MKTITLTRSSLGPDFTAGVLTCPSLDEGLPDLILATVERPWLNNAPHISCIPAGTYTVQYAWSARWNRLMPMLLDVPHRSLIEIHPANTAADVEGCIGPGLRATDSGVASSIPACEKFNAWLGIACRDHVQITITDPPVRPPTVTV